jgi:small conductance mechanosensitive channel
MNFSIEQLTNVEGWLNLLIPYGLKLLGAIAILVLGRWAAQIAIAVFRRSLNRARVDDTVTGFLGTVGYIALMAFVVIAALGQLGVKTTAAAAIIGGMALALGLSLQGQISAVAAGVLLTFFRPFRKGDFVQVAGEFGTVEEIGLANTLLVTANNQEVTIPNNQIWGGPITNFSARDTRRMDLTVNISPASDLDRAKAVLRELLEGDERVLKEPAPAIMVNAITESSVDILFRPWFKRAEFWDAYWDMVERIKRRFDEEGIDFARQRRFIEMSGATAED